MKNELVVGALIQPKNRDYMLDGAEREAHLELRDDDLSYCIRTGGRLWL